MASLTQWTWVWVNSGSWWWTGRPGVLRFMGSQRVGHDWATELNWTELNWTIYIIIIRKIDHTSSPSPRLNVFSFFLLELLLFSLMSNYFVTPWTVAHQALCPWDFPGKNTGVSCHFLLQGIFLTQGSNSGLLHWQADSWPLSHQGSPLFIT